MAYDDVDGRACGVIGSASLHRYSRRANLSLSKSIAALFARIVIAARALRRCRMGALCAA